MTFTPDHVDFICYNEDNTTSPEATVMGWGATQVNPNCLLRKKKNCKLNFMFL